MDLRLTIQSFQITFQCSSASRKFLNRSSNLAECPLQPVSVLFSEPKIPQFMLKEGMNRRERGFSALQRAENSSIVITIEGRVLRSEVSVLFSEPKIPQWCEQWGTVIETEKFQCSSASRKFLNVFQVRDRLLVYMGFSALQRAENSSIVAITMIICACLSFSALQRAENSSIFAAVYDPIPIAMFQCSSASRKFLNSVRSSDVQPKLWVSVLFSEPKIPQL